MNGWSFKGLVLAGWVVAASCPGFVRAASPAAGMAAGARAGGRTRVAALLGPEGRSAAVHRMFLRYDGDNDRFLAPAECTRFVREPANLPLDLDGDGRVSESEFARSVLRVEQPRLRRMRSRLVEPLWQARTLAAEGAFEEALTLCRQVSEDDPEAAGPHLAAGRLLGRMERLLEARKEFEAAASLAPGGAEAWLELAVVERRLGLEVPSVAHLERGMGCVEPVMVLPEGGSRQVEEIACMVAEVERLKRAFAGDSEVERYLDVKLDWLRSFPGDQPRNRRLSAWLEVEALGKQGRFSEGLAVVERALTGAGGGPDGWQTRAALLTALGRFGEAASSLSRARTEGASNACQLALELGNELDRGERALAVETQKRLFERAREPWELQEAGWQLAYRNEWKLALPWFERAIAVSPEVQRSSLLLALCWEAVGQLGKARELVDALTSPPSEEPPMLRVAAGLCLRTGRPEAAIAAANEAIAQEPRDAANWVEAARLQRLARGNEDIEDLLRAGVRVASVESLAWAELAYRIGQEMALREGAGLRVAVLVSDLLWATVEKTLARWPAELR